MDVDRSAKRPPLVCYKCRKPGHMARNCRSCVDIRRMNYEELSGYFVQKQKEEADAKAKKDFPDEVK